jgi:hypothetical protein
LCRGCAAEVYGGRAPTPEYGERVARLLFGTAAQESGLEWERQRSVRWETEIGGFSKWQVEAGSIEASLWYLRRRRDVLERATGWLFGDSHAPVNWPDVIPFGAVLWALRLNDNDRIGVLFARVHYFRVAEPVPGTVEEQAGYWKRWYNSAAGAGTVEQYLGNWERLCARFI